MKQFNVVPLSKICSDCQEEKSLEDYYLQTAGLYGRISKCKNCMRARAKKRDRSIYHGISESVIKFMLDAQNNSCRICDVEFESKVLKTEIVRVGYRIDHNHSHCPGSHGCPKCIRGLLCHKCNVMLGNYERLVALGRTEIINVYLGLQ